jgi:hypothetical protein
MIFKEGYQKISGLEAYTALEGPSRYENQKLEDPQAP